MNKFIVALLLLMDLSTEIVWPDPWVPNNTNYKIKQYDKYNYPPFNKKKKIQRPPPPPLIIFTQSR